MRSERRIGSEKTVMRIENRHGVYETALVGLFTLAAATALQDELDWQLMEGDAVACVVDLRAAIWLFNPLDYDVPLDRSQPGVTLKPRAIVAAEAAAPTMRAWADKCYDGRLVSVFTERAKAFSWVDDRVWCQTY